MLLYVSLLGATVALSRGRVAGPPESEQCNQRGVDMPANFADQCRLAAQVTADSRKASPVRAPGSVRPLGIRA